MIKLALVSMSYHKLFLGFLIILLVSLFTLTNPSVVRADGPVSPYSFSAVTGSNPGQITLMWVDDTTASQYDVMYGTIPGNYVYGVQDIPEKSNALNTYTINLLNPGQKYYFKLIAEKEGQFFAQSGPVWAVARMGTVKVPVSVQTQVQPVSQANQAVQSVPSSTSAYSFSAKTGSVSGTVDLMWVDDGTANQYDLVYGTQPGKYIYGVQNLPEIQNSVNKFTVRLLNPGQRYYFAVGAERNNSTVQTTNSVSAIAR